MLMGATAVTQMPEDGRWPNKAAANNSNGMVVIFFNLYLRPHPNPSPKERELEVGFL
jgi:hypothetical protein